MQVVDFDEDGDADLILGKQDFGQRYFERLSAREVIERIGDASPLNVFNGRMQVVADMDGDGRLEILVQGGDQSKDVNMFADVEMMPFGMSKNKP